MIDISRSQLQIKSQITNKIKIYSINQWLDKKLEKNELILKPKNRKPHIIKILKYTKNNFFFSYVKYPTVFVLLKGVKRDNHRLTEDINKLKDENKQYLKKIK